jgi:HK97 family phage portal protein
LEKNILANFWDKFKKKNTSIVDRVAAALGGDTLNVNHKSAMRQATVYSCVRVIAQTLQSAPIILYRKTKDNKRERATDHPLYQLTSKPNPYQTSITAQMLMGVNMCLRGNFYAQIVRAGGRVVEYLPLSPDKVTVTQNEKTPWEFSYKVGDVLLPQSEMLHIFDLSLNGITGISPIDHAKVSIGLGIAAETYGSKFFQNNAMPSAVLEVPSVLEDESYDRLKKSWQDAYGGENKGSVAVLEAGTTYKPITMTHEQGQFLDTRKFQRSEICGLFGVPPHMIGDLQYATFSNIEHQSIEFINRGILPRVRAIESEMNRKLLNEKEQNEYYFEFLLEGLMRGDLKSRAEAYHIFITDGVMNPNEVRSRENLNPYDGGEIYRTQLNTGAIGSAQ